MPMEPMGPVVVGVDGSPASLEAVELAAEEAVARVAPLVVAHAQDTVGHAPTASSRRLLSVAMARASAAHPGLSVSGFVAAGKPADVLNEVADLCLLVVGYRGGNGPHAAWTVARIVQKARVPVIVHRPLDTHGTAALPRPILVGAGDRDADDVVAFAFAEAAIRGADILAMRVGQPDEGPDYTATERSLGEALAAWSDKYPDIVVRHAVDHGLDVALPLAAASNAAQLVVVGSSTHGHPGWPSLASVSRFLIRRAHCPVAVVPGT